MPVFVVNFHYSKDDSSPSTDRIDTRKLRIKKDVSVLAAKLQTMVAEVARIHNAPKQVSARVSDVFYDVEIPRLYCKFTEEIAKAHAEKQSTIHLQVTLASDIRASRALALAMCLHPRLGCDSTLSVLDSDTMREMVFRVFKKW